MDVREKLVELIAQKVCDTWSESCDEWLPHDCGKCYANDCHISEIADHLISNGVTVQEWISVDDRLPEYPGHYLVCTSINYWHGGCMDINENHKYHPNGTPVGYDGSTMSVLDCYYDVTGHWNRACDSHVTHWMPIPEPPKGE